MNQNIEEEMKRPKILQLSVDDVNSRRRNDEKDSVVSELHSSTGNIFLSQMKEFKKSE